MDILIGVGGTGAKVVESVLHSCAVGLGPKRLHVGFVDQDRGNGNVSRALTTRETLQRAREAWLNSGEAHYLGASDLFACDFPLIGGDRWVPHAEEKMTLLQILGDLSEDDRKLVNLLFAPGEDEQGMELDEGYRGRAHVGAAAITAAVAREGEKFWDELRDLIQSARKGDPVRLVLAGSAFGGTGAAGFPIIARLIRRWLKKAQINQHFEMAGVLMLPYFDFDPPEDANDNVARAEDLLSQTRSALNYYHSHFRNSGEKTFDDLFLVGWGARAHLGYHKRGRMEQRNPALLPELIAALGVCGFYDPDRKPTGGVLACARDAASAVHWSDLPSPDPAKPDAPYLQFGRQLRFATAFRFWEPLLKKDSAVWDNSYQRYPWYGGFGLDTIDYHAASPVPAIDALSDYVDAFVEWAAAIQFYATERTGIEFDLWDVSRLLRGTPDFESPQRPFTLRKSLEERAWPEAYAAVIQPRLQGHKLPDASVLFGMLNRLRSAPDSKGMGGIVRAMHENSTPIDQAGGR